MNLDASDRHAMALGHAVWSWNDLHEALGHLNCAILHGHLSDQALAKWHAIKNDAEQRKRLRQSTVSRLHARPESLRAVQWLIDRVEDIRETRNDLNHSPYAILHSDNGESIISNSYYGKRRAANLDDANLLATFAALRSRCDILRSYADQLFPHIIDPNNHPLVAKPTLTAWQNTEAEAPDAIDYDQEIKTLREKVNAANLEFDIALMMHETWRAAAGDRQLHSRMGKSFASNTFLVVRDALRREMLLALARLWDRDNRAVGMDRIGSIIRDENFMKALAQKRAGSDSWPGTLNMMQQSLTEFADQALAIIDKYADGGSHCAVRDKLRQMRNQQLAHRQTKVETVPTLPTNGEIETLYQDMSELIQALMHLALATAYNPNDSMGVYQHYATFFWASVRGEKTEGHPLYREKAI